MLAAASAAPPFLPWVLAGVGLFLFVAGSLVRREVLLHPGYVALAVATAFALEDAPLFRGLFAVVAWFALMLFHLYVWREVLARLRRSHGPGHATDPQSLVGAIGDVKLVGDHKVVRVVDEDWPLVGDPDPPVGATVQVVGADAGRLRVRLLD